MGSNRHACNATQLRKARSVAMHLTAFPLEYLAAPCARKVCGWRDHMIWGEIVWGGCAFFTGTGSWVIIMPPMERAWCDGGRPATRTWSRWHPADRSPQGMGKYRRSLGGREKTVCKEPELHPRRSIDNGPAGRALRKRTVLLCCSSSFSLFSFSDDERHFDSSSSISYIVGEREKKKGISMTMHMSWLLAIYTRSLAMPIANRVWTNLSYAPYCL